MLPSVFVELGRRFFPIAPLFSGEYLSPEEITDERPWLSDARLTYAEKELEEAIADSEKSNQPLMNSLLIPCLLVNLLTAQRRNCKILDFGGGTGIVYFQLRHHFTYRDSVTWIVTDNNRLIRLGEQYKGVGDKIYFSETIPDQSNVDVIFINTALQYVADWRYLLAELVKLCPEFFILTRLIAGDIKTYFSRQNNIPGGKTPSLFLSQHELIGFFVDYGFELIHSSHAGEDTWSSIHYEHVPHSEQIENTMNLVFKRKGFGLGNNAEVKLG